MIKHVTIIGAGRVGGALATRLRDMEVSTRVVTRSEFEAWCMSNEVVGDVVVLAVRDTNVVHVSEAIARGADSHTDNVQTDKVQADKSHTNERLRGALVIHLNGSMRLDALRACLDAGARVGAAHPFQTFADADPSLLDGIGWGIECTDDVWPLLEEFVKRTGGIPHRLDLVDDHHKRIYHTAAIAASNYTYAAYELGRRLALKAGIPVDVFLLPIIEQTHTNAAIALHGNTAFLLTGPIQRGDVAAVARQLDSIPAAERNVYIHLSLALLHLNKEKMPEEAFTKLLALLSEALTRQ